MEVLDEGVDEGFCSCVGEGWTETDNVFEVKSCFVDLFGVLFEGEGLIENGAKINDVRGGGYRESVDIEGGVVGGFLGPLRSAFSVGATL